MIEAYDRENIFARILRGEIPNATVYEDDHVLAFSDINPQRPLHSLVIPKGAYRDLTDFAENASEAEIVAYVRALAKVARASDVTETGYRVISNTGADGHQEVPHLHFHIIGGAPAGPMARRMDVDADG